MNRKKSVRFYSLVVPALLLSGCAGTRDLATEPNALPAKEQSIAKRISEKAASTCTVVTHNRNEPPPPGGGVTIKEAPVIVRLYSSTNSSFYRAEAVVHGAWDNIYFDSKNERIVCGEQSWQAIKDAGKVIFREVSTEPIKGEAKVAPAQESNAANAGPIVMPSAPETTRHEKTAIKESRQSPEITPAPPRVNLSTSPKPSGAKQELVKPSTKTSQRSLAPQEDPGKCIVKPVMTDEEMARCAR